MKKKISQIVFAAGITIILLFFLLREISFSDLKQVFSSISYDWLFLGFLSYGMCYKMRAIRFSLLFTNKIKKLFSIVSVNTLFNNTIPARLGELSFLYLIKKTGKSSVGESAGALVIARIIDLFVVGVIFLSGVLIIQEVPDLFRNVITTISVFVVVMIILLIALIARGSLFIAIAKKILNLLRLDKFRIFQKIIREFDNIPEALNKLKERSKIYQVVVMTFLAWFFNYLFVCLVVRSMGINVSLGGVLLAATFVVLTSILPINTLGGFGVIEGVWAASLFALGIPKELAISSGFAYHIILLTFSAFLGLVGYLRLKYYYKENFIN